MRFTNALRVEVGVGADGLASAPPPDCRRFDAGGRLDRRPLTSIQSSDVKNNTMIRETDPNLG
jgi:hypothetical protein